MMVETVDEAVAFHIARGDKFVVRHHIERAVVLAHITEASR